ncbi:MAG TPA: SDR family NAD(P)-dependent oxidoreductase, partial [Micromonosporaceae bacterium]|nr:SDR family NAD(P)-dependent oxidoreductase [Micromonosporaceae bacterium]
GGRDSLAEVVTALRERGVRVSPLSVSHAFHSPLMHEVLDDFREALRGVRFREPTLTVVTNLTGEVARPAEVATVDYWVRHIAEPVRFEAAMRTVDRRGRHVLVEVGPSSALLSLARQCLPAGRHHPLASLRRHDVEGATIRRSVAQLYVAGLAVSWAGFHRGRERRKMTLPTYGFDRRRYWLPVEGNRHGLGNAHTAAGVGGSPSGGDEASAALPFLHHVRWVPQPLPGRPAPSRHVLAVNLDEPLLTPLAAAAARAGVELSVAVRAEDAGEVLRDRRVTDVCWFWRPEGPAGEPAVGPVGAAGPRAGCEHAASSLRAGCERNYRGLLDLLGVLSREGFGRNQRLWLVTARAQWLPGDAAGTGEDLAAATLWGFGRVLFNEYPTYRVTLVDLPATGGAEPLVDELAAADSGEYQVAFRDGQRHVPRLLPGTEGNAGTEGDTGTEGDAGADQTSNGLTVRPDRTYLVTGGLGALGLAPAEKLVELGARHLALVSRSGAPAADAGELWQRLRERAQVTVYAADIGEPGDVDKMMGELRAGPYPVGGIVHAAGLLDDKPVAATTWETLDALFRSKVYGGALLHEAARDLPELGFFVVYSSAAAVLGGAGQANYAAANAFLDGLVHWRVRQGLPGLSLNWGPWSDAGMSARLSRQHIRALEAEGIRFFTPARALSTLASLLAQPVTQVGVGECDWDRYLAGKPLANAMLAGLASGGAPARAVDLDALL